MNDQPAPIPVLELFRFEPDGTLNVDWNLVEKLETVHQIGVINGHLGVAWGHVLYTLRKQLANDYLATHRSHPHVPLGPGAIGSGEIDTLSWRANGLDQAAAAIQEMRDNKKLVGIAIVLMEMDNGATACRALTSTALPVGFIQDALMTAANEVFQADEGGAMHPIIRPS